MTDQGAYHLDTEEYSDEEVDSFLTVKGDEIWLQTMRPMDDEGRRDLENWYRDRNPPAQRPWWRRIFGR